MAAFEVTTEVQMDQATSSHQELSGQLGERHQDPDLDGGERLPAGSDRPKDAWRGRESLHFFAGRGPHRIRESAHSTGV